MHPRMHTDAYTRTGMHTPGPRARGRIPGGMEYEIHATRDGAYGPVDYTTPLPGGLTFAGMLAAPPETIWRGYGTESRIPKNLFDEYAKGADRLYAYRLENPIRYGKPKTLSDIGLKRAPQSWCYLPETGPAGPEPAMEGLN